MKLGILVRADDTGLGVQSWEAYRALQPERALVIEMGAGAHRRFDTHFEWYPGATRVAFAGGRLPEPAVRRWLNGLDVVLSFETFYDPDFYRWAHHAGVATAVQVNPELLRPLATWPQRPTAWWAPTSWRLDHLPNGTRVVPVPVADDRFDFRIPERDGPLRILHVEGHRALVDRNGTGVMYEALRRVVGPMHVTMVTQESRATVPAGRRSRPGIKVELRTGGVANYWDLYRDQDVLVLPRRYGGLSLVAQEAMAAGLAVVMTDAEPQCSTWPIVPVRARQDSPVNMQCGPVRPVNANPIELAKVLSDLAKDPDAVRAAQVASLRWAMAHRWSVLAPLYRDELERAVAVRRGTCCPSCGCATDREGWCSACTVNTSA